MWVKNMLSSRYTRFVNVYGTNTTVIEWFEWTTIRTNSFNFSPKDALRKDFVSKKIVVEDTE